MTSLNNSSGLSLLHPASHEHNYLVLLCSLLILIGVIGNVFVCLAIMTEKRLQNTTNYFLASLAVVDLLVSAIVMPATIHQEYHMGRVDTGFGLCLSQVYADVLLCSASIVHMSIISLDRYLGISRPLRLRASSPRAVLFKILLTWLIAGGISSPIAILALLEPANIYVRGSCGIFNPHYQICGSILAFYIPLFIMLIAYFKTSKLLAQQAMLCRRTDERGLRRTMTRSRQSQRPNVKTFREQPTEMTSDIGASTSSGEPGSRKSSSHSQANVTVRPGSGSGWLSLLGPALSDADPKGNVQLPEENAHIHALLAMHILQRTEGIKLPPLPEDEEDLIGEIAGQLKEKWRERTAHLMKFVRRVNALEVANEQKATRVLGLVFTVFFVCWFPFFSTNVILACCSLHSSQDGCPWFKPGSGLISLFAWLGYLSSVANPLIYTAFNSQFRAVFKRFLACKARSRESEVSQALAMSTRRRHPSCPPPPDPSPRLNPSSAHENSHILPPQSNGTPSVHN